MSIVLAVFAAFNFVFMMANLGFYAWGSHSPASLGIGVANGFAMLLCAVVAAHTSSA
jgi:hypothetical protein